MSPAQDAKRSSLVVPDANGLALSNVPVAENPQIPPRVDDGLEIGNQPTVVAFPQMSKARGVLLVCTISSAGFLTTINVQSVVILLPSIGEAIGIPASRQSVVVSIYNISLACLMLLWGRLADVYGHRPVFLIGTSLFTLSNLCLPFSTYEIPLYILRLLQGVGGAAMIPAGLGMVGTSFPPGKSRNRAYITIAAVASLGSVLGNIAGGVIGGFLSWKWVFWIPAIMAAFTTISAFVITSAPQLRKTTTASRGSSQRSKTQSVDWLGAAMISTSLLLLLVALTEGNVIGWATAWIPPLIVAAVLLLVTFVFWQRRLERISDRPPLLRVSMFKNIRFSALFVLVGCFYASFNSYLVFATYFYQDYLGLNELNTALRFLPTGVAGILISFAVSPALSRIRGFYILLFGLICSIGPPFLLALPAIPPETSYWAYGFPAMCLCSSVEIVFPLISLLVAEELPLEDQALGGGLLQTANNVGRALGVAIATAVQVKIKGNNGDGSGDYVGNDDFLRGVRAAQWVNVGLAVTSTAIALAFFRNLGRR